MALLSAIVGLLVSQVAPCDGIAMKFLDKSQDDFSPTDMIIGAKMTSSTIPPHLTTLNAYNAQFTTSTTTPRPAPNPCLYQVNNSNGTLDFLPSLGMTMMPPSATEPTLHIVPGIHRGDGVAWGTMIDNLMSTGWINLEIETTESPRVGNDIKMYGAGYVEGLMTAHRLAEFNGNMALLMMQDPSAMALMGDLKASMQADFDHIQRKANFHGSDNQMEAPADPYWRHVRYQLLQLYGLRDAYNFVGYHKNYTYMTMVDLFVVNSHSEIPELLEIVSARQRAAAPPLMTVVAPMPIGDMAFLQQDTPSPNGTVQDLSDSSWERRLIKKGHCSALVRLTSGAKDLMVGHTTWGDYSSMTRMFKYYKFGLPDSNTMASVVGFSSYPGCISSTDNYYILNSGITAMDTSLEVLDPKLYDEAAKTAAAPDVPTFLHVMAINRIAQSAGHWSEMYINARSGASSTSAQWLVVDFNRFTPGDAVSVNTLWVVEHVPGMAHKEDVSLKFAAQGYWASYNRPYFDEVRQVSGHTAAENENGDLYSFANSPRGKIFSKWGRTVEDLADMRHVMNRNDSPWEGVTPNAPGHAISARFDLDLGVGRIPNGGIDAKVTNRCMFREMQCQAISGPSHDKQPIFHWTPNGTVLFPLWPHAGLPEAWDFGWEQLTPNGPMPSVHDIPAC